MLEIFSILLIHEIRPMSLCTMQNRVFHVVNPPTTFINIVLFDCSECYVNE